MSGLQPRAQTEPILDELNPVWDTALYIPIHSLREDLVLEAMDWNDVQKDKFLGMCELFVKDIVAEKKSQDEETVYEALPPVKRTVDLISHERKTGRRSDLRHKEDTEPELEDNLFDLFDSMYDDTKEN